MAASKYKTTIKTREPVLINKPHRIFKFKVQLLNAPYPIWRVVLIDEDDTLADLQNTLLSEMGWEFEHLYELNIRDQCFVDYSVYDYSGYFYKELYDASEYLVKDMFNVGSKAKLTYDFGDSWEHSVVVQDIIVEPYLTPYCIKGRGCCPPEDCGGVYGFAAMLRTQEDPNDPEYDSTMEWLGEKIDPDSFSL